MLTRLDQKDLQLGRGRDQKDLQYNVLPTVFTVYNYTITYFRV